MRTRGSRWRQGFWKSSETHRTGNSRNQCTSKTRNQKLMSEATWCSPCSILEICCYTVWKFMTRRSCDAAIQSWYRRMSEMCCNAISLRQLITFPLYLQHYVAVICNQFHTNLFLFIAYFLRYRRVRLYKISSATVTLQHPAGLSHSLCWSECRKERWQWETTQMCIFSGWTSYSFLDSTPQNFF